MRKHQRQLVEHYGVRRKKEEKKNLGILVYCESRLMNNSAFSFNLRRYFVLVCWSIDGIGQSTFLGVMPQAQTRLTPPHHNWHFPLSVP